MSTTIPFHSLTLPALIAVKATDSSYQPIRPLTTEEQQELSSAGALYEIIKPIIVMFGVADLNYRDFCRLAEALLRPENRPQNSILEANRAVFNYVAAADALLNHTQTRFKALCRKGVVKTNTFHELCEMLKRNNDDFQFLCEFRDHVLHNALPVGSLSETKSTTDGIGFSLTYASESLRRSRREWNSCRLLRKQSTVDLKRQIEAFHAIMHKDILKSIIGTFLSDLHESNDLYHRLAKEAITAHPNHSPGILTRHTSNGANFVIEVGIIPVDIFEDLGLSGSWVIKPRI
jgi:hypothetical protein